MRISHANRFLLLVICAMFLVYVLSSCCDDSTAFDTPESRFVIVDSGNLAGCQFAVIKDNETGTHYLFIQARYRGGLSLIYNPDGTPYLGETMDGGADHEN